MNLASSKRQWPLGRGFERYYGFLGGETNQWYPDLVYDNHPVPAPKTPEEGYHLTVDLTDKAIEFIQDAKAIAPDKPFFLYYCPGAAHAPHHVSKEWADKYKGIFDMGYEAYREVVFERQKKLGIIAEGAELSPIEPVRRHDEPRRQAVVAGRPRAALGVALRRREAAVLPHGRGLRRVPQPRRPRARPPARLPRGERSAREHDRRARLRQRRLRRGRAERVGQREQVLQRPARHDGGEPQVPRRARQPADVQPLPDRLGLGVQHAVQAVEALRELRGRHRRPADRLLARRARGTGRAPAPVQPRRRHRADPLRVPRRRAAGRRQRLHAEAARGRQLQEQPRRPGGAVEGDAVLLDARHPGDLAQGLEGRDRRSGRARVVGRLPPAALGAVRHDDRPERVPRPRGRAPREAAGADRALVGRGRHLPGASRSSRAGRSRSSAPSGPSSRARARATPTTRAARRCRSRWRRTSGTARTRSRRRWRSTRRRPAA